MMSFVFTVMMHCTMHFILLLLYSNELFYKYMKHGDFTSSDHERVSSYKLPTNAHSAHVCYVHTNCIVLVLDSAYIVSWVYIPLSYLHVCLHVYMLQNNDAKMCKYYISIY